MGSNTWETDLLPPDSYPFRFFRLVQTGQNSSNSHIMSLCGFEVYGDFLEYDLQSKHLRTATLSELAVASNHKEALSETIKKKAPRFTQLAKNISPAAIRCAEPVESE